MIEQKVERKENICTTCLQENGVVEITVRRQLTFFLVEKSVFSKSYNVFSRELEQSLFLIVK
jgi:hypothetical protein